MILGAIAGYAVARYKGVLVRLLDQLSVLPRILVVTPERSTRSEKTVSASSKSVSTSIIRFFRVRDPFAIYADPAYLHLALVQLLVHCAGLCPRVREIELQAESGIESDGFYIRFQPCSPEDARAIHDLYVNPDGGVEEEPPALGLGPGAGLVREILRKHFARLKVESQSEDSVRFSLLFPLKPEDSAAPVPTSVASQAI